MSPLSSVQFQCTRKNNAYREIAHSHFNGPTASLQAIDLTNTVELNVLLCYVKNQLLLHTRQHQKIMQQPSTAKSSMFNQADIHLICYSTNKLFTYITLFLTDLLLSPTWIQFVQQNVQPLMKTHLKLCSCWKKGQSINGCCSPMCSYCISYTPM